MNKQFLFTKVAVKADSDEFEVIASTSAVDRQGDVVDQMGWDLANYLLNPVILWAHDYSMLPVGKATRAEVTDKGLVISGVFASAEANPLAQQVKQLYQEGILNAVSVGFMARERNGNTITKSELLELSFVPVPANPEALSLLAVHKGLDQNLVDAICSNQKNDDLPQDESVGDVVETDTPEALPVADEGSEVATEDKAGRVVSTANRKLLSNCVETLKQTLSVLEQVLSADDGKSADVTNTPDERSNDTFSKDFVEEITTQVKNLQNVMRINDKVQEIALSSINEFIKTHSK